MSHSRGGAQRLPVLIPVCAVAAEPGARVPQSSDQAHLIAEFRAIAGATPRALLDELRSDQLAAEIDARL